MEPTADRREHIAPVAGHVYPQETASPNVAVEPPANPPAERTDDLGGFTVAHIFWWLLARLPREQLDALSDQVLPLVAPELVADTVAWCRQQRLERAAEKARQEVEAARAAEVAAEKQRLRAERADVLSAGEELWAAWLAEVGGPEALAAWQPDPIEPSLEVGAWVAIGDTYAESPGVGASPEEAVRHVNEWNLEVYADPVQAYDASGDAPAPGTPLSALLWSPAAEAPRSRCALLHVRGSAASIAVLVGALGGAR